MIVVNIIKYMSASFLHKCNKAVTTQLYLITYFVVYWYRFSISRRTNKISSIVNKISSYCSSIIPISVCSYYSSSIISLYRQCWSSTDTTINTRDSNVISRILCHCFHKTLLLLCYCIPLLMLLVMFLMF